MKSVMSHNFSQVPRADIPRSVFDRSFGYKTTFDAGYLIPFMIDEALPGDTFTANTTLFGRLATPIFPIMDNIHLETFYFAVPYRLIWDNWQKFNGEQTDPGDSTDYLTPQIVAPAVTGAASGSLWDYFGMPIGIPDLTVNSFFHRAYNLVWNEWFRDENLQDSVVVDRDDGPDTYGDYVLLRRGKRYDYFTSCLPWPQKGPAVSLPLGTSAPVYGAGTVNANTNIQGYQAWNSTDAATQFGGLVKEAAAVRVVFGNPFTGLVAGDTVTNLSLATKAQYASLGSTFQPPFADLSDATAATINALREAFQVQRLYERDARGGTRYTEVIRSHFGVVSDDARLQRPEYLGGGSMNLNITPVAQTSKTDVSPQGNVAGFGTFTGSSHGFTKSFTEHCVIIGLVCARADLNYQQGLERMHSRRTRFDYYWPVLAHLGEQAVLNKEIWAQDPANTNPSTGVAYNEEAFGYQERYAEYRYKNSLITGLFRSDAASNIDEWHLAQDFSTLPALNSDFIVEDPPLDRALAVPTQPHFIMDSYTKVKAARPMPTYSVPGLVDHF